MFLNILRLLFMLVLMGWNLEQMDGICKESDGGEGGDERKSERHGMIAGV